MPKYRFTHGLAKHIRYLYGTGLWTQLELADVYGTNQSMVSKIVSEQIWDSSKMGTIKLSYEMAEAIRKDWAGGEFKTHQDLGIKWGISRRTVVNVLSRSIWEASPSASSPGRSKLESVAGSAEKDKKRVESGFCQDDEKWRKALGIRLAK